MCLESVGTCAFPGLLLGQVVDEMVSWQMQQSGWAAPAVDFRAASALWGYVRQGRPGRWGDWSHGGPVSAWSRVASSRPHRPHGGPHTQEQAGHRALPSCCPAQFPWAVSPTDKEPMQFEELWSPNRAVSTWGPTFLPTGMWHVCFFSDFSV